MSGLASSHIRGLTLQHCHFAGVADTSNTLSFVDSLVLDDVTVNGKPIVR